MITDEQAINALTIFYDETFHPNRTNLSLVEDMRRALEDYDRNKWVKFDVDDESTWPQRKGHHIACDGRNVAHKYWDNTGDRRFRNNSWFVADSVLFKKVTHWQYLPEFKV